MKKFLGPLNGFFSVFLIISGVIFSLTSPFVVLIIPGLIIPPYMNSLLEKLRKPLSMGGKLGSIVLGFILLLVLMNYYGNKPIEKEVQEEPGSQTEKNESLKHDNAIVILQNLMKLKPPQGDVKNEEPHAESDKDVNKSVHLSKPEGEQKKITEERHQLSAKNKPEEWVSSIPLPPLYKDRKDSICYGTVHTKGSSLNIRKGMGKDTKIIYKVPKGSSLLIFESIGEWYKVQLNDGTVGYASKDYIKIDEKIEPSVHLVPKSEQKCIIRGEGHGGMSNE